MEAPVGGRACARTGHRMLPLALIRYHRASRAARHQAIHRPGSLDREPRAAHGADRWGRNEWATSEAGGGSKRRIRLRIPHHRISKSAVGGGPEGWRQDRVHQESASPRSLTSRKSGDSRSLHPTPHPSTGRRAVPEAIPAEALCDTQPRRSCRCLSTRGVRDRVNPVVWTQPRALRGANSRARGAPRDSWLVVAAPANRPDFSRLAAANQRGRWLYVDY